MIIQRMSLSGEKKKELIKLKSQKQKCLKQGNIKLAAEYANSIGNLYSELGETKQAINEHETELSYCEDLKDVCGEAVASRKLGECYMELSEFETALEFVNKYIALARTLPNKEELQRGYMTLGRLHLCEIATLTTSSDKFKVNSKRAEAAFMKALEWTDKIKSTLKAVEYNDMKARALLNLGLLADHRNEIKESYANITNAITLARKYNLTTVLVMCRVNLARIMLRKAEFVEAQVVLEEALENAKQTEFQDVVDVTKLIAQVSVELGVIGKSLETVKAVMKPHSPAERDALKPTAVKLFKISRARQQLPTASDLEKCKHYEKIADYCCDLNAYHQALKYYQKTLSIMNQLKLSHEKITPILSSIAQTNQDIKLYSEAVNYYCQEIKIQKQLENHDQACRSLLSLAFCMEMQNAESVTVMKCYHQAEACAKQTANVKLQLLILRTSLDYLKLIGDHTHHDECMKKIEAIKSRHNVTSESQEESQSSSHIEEHDDSSDGGFELSEAEEEATETEIVRSTKMRAYRILKNEVGETKLHQAVIKGKQELVVDLLKKGHPVNIRDHAGWMPLHEAANHNRVEIAKLLINFGGEINDRGGEKCRGVTPLMDACSTGGCEMIQLLLENGANTIAKDDSGSYPLDALLTYRVGINDELTGEQRRDLDEIEDMLRLAMIKKGINPKSKPFKETQNENDGIADGMSNIIPPTKSALLDSDDDDVLPSSVSKRPPIALSPTQSAADMYRNSIAKVRQSGKRAPIPNSATLSKSNDEPEAALLPADCDADLPTTGDWLVNDTEANPVRQRNSESNSTRKPRTAKRSSKRASNENAALTIPETPERSIVLSSRSPSPIPCVAEATIAHDQSLDISAERASSPPLSPSSAVSHGCADESSEVIENADNSNSKRSRESSPVLTGTSSVHETDDNSSPVKKRTRSSREPSPALSSKSSVYGSGAAGQCESFSSPPIKQKEKSRKSRSRIRLPSMSPDNKDMFAPSSQPLTPAFNGAAKHTDSDVTPTNTPQKENISPRNTEISDSEQITDKKIPDDIYELLKTVKDNSKSETQSSGQQADTQSVSASQPSPAGRKRQSSQSMELQRVPIPLVNENGSDIETDNMPRSSSRSSVRSALSIEWSQQDEGTNDKKGKQIPSPADKDVDSTSGKANKNGSILDEIIGEPSKKAKRRKSNVKNSQPSAQRKPPTSTIPTSTPLRKSLNLIPIRRSSPGINNTHVNRPHSPANSEAKDSGFPQDSFVAPGNPFGNATVPGNPFNSSMSSIRGGVRDSVNTSMTENSYYNNIRILVQWKSRTLLIPIPRCESPTISWLCDELVRRLSRRRQVSSQASSGGSVPDSQQIILTRALDGAELFPEDTITDILNDNEKVVAVEMEDC